MNFYSTRLHPSTTCLIARYGNIIRNCATLVTTKRVIREPTNKPAARKIASGKLCFKLCLYLVITLAIVSKVITMCNAIVGNFCRVKKSRAGLMRQFPFASLPLSFHLVTFNVTFSLRLISDALPQSASHARPM